MIFKNTHEAIVDQATWDLTQKVIQTRRRVDTTGVANPLTGLLYCADCGAKCITKAKERKTLQAEKKTLSPVHIKRRLELASSITGLTKEIEELRSKKNRVLARAKCDDDKGMNAFSAKLDQSKRDYNDLIERKTALTEERQDGIARYEDVYECIQPGDEDAVKAERQRLRAESESRISEAVSEIYGKAFDPKLLSDAAKETDLDLAFDRRAEAHRRWLYELNKSRYTSRSIDNER